MCKTMHACEMFPNAVNYGAPTQTCKEIPAMYMDKAIFPNLISSIPLQLQKTLVLFID